MRLVLLLMVLLVSSCQKERVNSKFSIYPGSQSYWNEEVFPDLTEKDIQDFKSYIKSYNSVFFKFDHHTLEEDSKQRLKKFIHELEKVKNAKVVLMGYADQVGSKKYNKNLSSQRVVALLKIIYASGVPQKNNIEVKPYSYGKHDPFISYDTVINNPHSRRVDIFILLK